LEKKIEKIQKKVKKWIWASVFAQKEQDVYHFWQKFDVAPQHTFS